jgi:hypothetical protein
VEILKRNNPSECINDAKLILFCWFFFGGASDSLFCSFYLAFVIAYILLSSVNVFKIKCEGME